MDGLSATASGVAVVSLAFQLGQSIKQLHDFWDSIKEAPDDIHAIQEDLGLLLSVIAEMANEVQHSGPDQTLTRALKACCDRANRLTDITNDMEPGFASRSLRVRKLTAFKAVLKSEKIHKFHRILEGLKSTLILAHQSSHSRLNRVRYQTQQQDLTTITKHLSSLKWEQMSATVTTVANSSTIDYEHTNAFRAETSRICRNVQNPVHRVGFDLGSKVVVEDLASNFAKDQSRTPQLLANAESDQSIHSHRDEIPRRARGQTLTKDTSTIRKSISQTLFGSIVTTTRTRSLKSRFVEDDDLEDEECQYEEESSFKILPAQWLLKLGFNYAYNFFTHDSSTQGWQWCIKPINLVPDDAPIFDFCEQGNLEKVRDLFSQNLASVRDMDSDGYTPLHFAVESHNPELCSFLIEAGADKDARTYNLNKTPLQRIYHGQFARDRLANTIDTCRIFESSLNFWDRYGDGWNILRFALLWHSTMSTTEAEPLATFCSWVVKSSSPDIKDNFIEDKVLAATYLANDKFADFIDLLLGLQPAGTLRDNADLLQYCSELLFHHITRQNWKIVNLFLAWGADPHNVATYIFDSAVAESALSTSMYSSWTFWGFRNVLLGMDLDLKDFAHKELEEGRPLPEAGWQMETLTALLELEFEPDDPPRETEEDDNRCDNCNRYLGLYRFNSVIVQPYWQVILESIKNGTYQQRTCSDTQDEKSSSSLRDLTILNDSTIESADDSAMSQDPAHSDQESPTNGINISSTVFDREEIWCTECWHQFKETGRRSPATSETESSNDDDASEDDFSPYLIHT